MDNVILIGMPGSGKSTVGVLLAKLLGYAFLDSDLLIQQRAGKRLFEILRDDGADTFARLEEEVNAGLDVHRTVIATGGSAVYSSRAMAHMRSIGTVVYLKVSEQELIRRIGDFSKRGILFREGETFSDLYRERNGLYARYADVAVPCEEPELLQSAEKIVLALRL